MSLRARFPARHGVTDLSFSFWMAPSGWHQTIRGLESGFVGLPRPVWKAKGGDRLSGRNEAPSSRRRWPFLRRRRGLCFDFAKTGVRRGGPSSFASSTKASNADSRVPVFLAKRSMPSMVVAAASVMAAVGRRGLSNRRNFSDRNQHAPRQRPRTLRVHKILCARSRRSCGPRCRARISGPATG